MDVEERFEALEQRDRQRECELRQVVEELRQLKERRALPRPTPSLLLVAVVVLAFTLTCARRAWASVTTPNAVVVTLHTEPQGLSSPVALPASNQAIIVSGTTITQARQGTGFVHLTYGTDGAIVTWSGIHAQDSPSGGPGLAVGYTFDPGVPVVDVGYGGIAELQVGPALNQLRVKNNPENTPGARALDTRLTFIW